MSSETAKQRYYVYPFGKRTTAIIIYNGSIHITLRDELGNEITMPRMMLKSLEEVKNNAQII